MVKYQILIVVYCSFSRGEVSEVEVFLESLEVFYVFKVDGLVVGKGVFIF